MIKSLRYILSMVLLAALLPVKAQEEGYLAEIGLAGGGCFYMGDANSTSLYSNTNGMVGIVARYNVNPRFSIKADLVSAGIEGSTRNMEGAVPAGDISFSRTVYDFGVQAECNFNAYGMTSWNGSRRLVPYYLLGVGMTYASKPAENVFAVNFPVGLGLRYKLAERVNLGLEWTMRFTSSDKLDVTGVVNGTSLNDPFQIKGKGFKNKDSYSFTMLSLTFDIFARPCDCN
ncbi:MAG: outer membrane beta-barrel protein [Bacteroidaceae bacterium]|nr:outer membrane beta-barrel protein [Bacteroidaceae bacterium]